VRGLTPQRLDGGTIHVAPAPGRRDLLKFMTSQRREQLGQMLGQILGRPLRVQMASGSSPAPGRPAGPAPRARPAASEQERQEAMNLPLVRDLLEAFDVTLVDVGRAPDREAGSAAPPPTDEADGEDDEPAR
jgi:hypothetical protein